MGLKEKRKPHKEKAKRKRGKKFKYSEEKEQNMINHFEELSKKKFLKKNNNFSQLITDYQNKNNVNSFKDNRIAENATNLSLEQKMKLRYKAQQMLKKSKKTKFAFDDDESENDIKLTHNGKEIDDNDNFSGNEDDEEYYKQMDDFIENNINSNPKLSKQEKFKEIIKKSKLLKQEKQRIKEETLNQIELLNDNFDEINSLLKKRKRTFNRFNDDYDKMTNQFIYSERTHPTERIKTADEIEEEKNNKLKKMEMKRLKEEVDNEDSGSERDENGRLELEDKNEKHLTKKERIEKLIQERLNKTRKVKEKKKVKEEESENEEDEKDSMSDLNELNNNDEEEEEEDDEENEDEEEENDDEEDEKEDNNDEEEDEKEDNDEENEDEEDGNESDNEEEEEDK